ncbi:hypothetical protein [Sphingobacterium hungaricum]|uniref:hypothetical protein n=1 Tax=Sphingobacterium hungaricum TaxID=2082723 RepID=UPI0018CA0ED5|nr:hypothetical protein [Sphingobacterium hungaricum]
MKKISFIFLSLIISLSTAYAQKGINFSHTYAAGNKLLMCVDSAAKNIYYDFKFPNQPNTSFNYLPEINNVSIQIYFKTTERIQDYRYTILVDNKPIVVNESIGIAQMKDLDRGDDELLRFTTLGIFPIKGKTITTLIYSTENPIDIYKSVFYGLPIPKAKIEVLAKRFATEKGVDYNYIRKPKERIDLTFTEKDDELTIVKETLDIDYVYYISIKNKKTDKIIFESNSWLYGGYLNEAGKLSPYIKIDRSIFKKSGNYEIIIQPLIDWDNCQDCNISSNEIENYVSRYTLSITLDEEIYTKKELLFYTLIALFSIGLFFLLILFFIKKKKQEKIGRKRATKKHRKAST